LPKRTILCRLISVNTHLILIKSHLQRGHRPTHFTHFGGIFAKKSCFSVPLILSLTYQNTILLPKKTYYFADSFWHSAAQKHSHFGDFVVHSKYSWVRCFCTEFVLESPIFLLEKHLNSATILPSKNRHILAEKMGFPAFWKQSYFRPLNGFLRFLAVTLVTIYDENGQGKGGPLPTHFRQQLAHFGEKGRISGSFPSDSFSTATDSFGEIWRDRPSISPPGPPSNQKRLQISLVEA